MEHKYNNRNKNRSHFSRERVMNEYAIFFNLNLFFENNKMFCMNYMKFVAKENPKASLGLILILKVH